MLLLAFLLGLWFGWIVETFGRQLKKERKQPLLSSNLSISIVSAVFAMAAGVFIYAFVARKMGAWDSWAIRVVNYMAEPDQVWPMLAFLGGWLGFHYRRPLGAFVTSLFVHSSSHSRNEARVRSKNSDSKINVAESVKAREWLTAAGGLPIIAAVVAILALLFFGSDLRSRLESLKFAGVEARFLAAASQHSMRNTFYEAGFLPIAMIAESGSNLKINLEINGRIQERIIDRFKFAETSPLTVVARRKLIERFHDTISIPFADAVSCYGRLSGTDIQYKAIKVARAWSGLSETIAGRAVGQEFQIEAIREKFAKEFGPKFEKVVADTLDLASSIQNESGCESFLSKSPSQLAEPFEGYLPQLFSDGYVIVFVASLIASTQNYDPAIEYLNRMGGFLAKDVTEEMGQAYFYLKRAAVKQYAHWFPRDGASDLERVREIIEGVLVTVTDPKTSAGNIDKQAVAYLNLEKARALNSEIFALVSDWQEGHRLSGSEIDLLDRLSDELQKWFRSRSPTVLADDIKDPMTTPTIELIATAYDTLAMSDIATSDSRQKRTKDRCPLIRERLILSKNLFQWWLPKRQPPAADSFYRSIIKTIDTHYELYDSFCN